MPTLNSMFEIALQLKIKFVPVYLFVVGSIVRPIINYVLLLLVVAV